MHVLALCFIYVMTLLSIAAVLYSMQVRKPITVTVGAAIVTVVMNLLEALAVIVLLRDSDFAGALAIAVVLWISELLYVIDALSLTGKRKLRSMTRLRISLVFSIVTLIIVSILAFA